MTLRQRRSPSRTLPLIYRQYQLKEKIGSDIIEEDQVHSYNMRKNSH